MSKILFICDALESFKIETDTTISLMVAAHELKAEILYCKPQDLYLENNIAYANTNQLEILVNNHSDLTLEKLNVFHDKMDSRLRGNDISAAHSWYKVGERLPKVNLNTFKAIMVRNDPPFNMEYYYLTQILTMAEQNGAVVINNSNALRNFNEKLAILNFPEFITPTIVTKNKDVILEFLQTHAQCVIKPIDLMAGRGVFKISLNDVNCGAILEASTNYFTQTVMVQRFIPEVIHGDRRIFIVHGEVISHCLYRIPQGNAIRGNIAAGGRGEVHQLRPEDYVVANKVAKWLKEQNIVFSGIDIIGNKLTEINITSPTGARQIFNHSGVNISNRLLSKIL